MRNDLTELEMKIITEKSLFLFSAQINEPDSIIIICMFLELKVRYSRCRRFYIFAGVPLRIYVLQSTFTRSHAPFEANTRTRTRIAVHGRSILFRFFQSRLSIVRHKRLVLLLRCCTGTFDSIENSSRNKLPI